MNYMYSDVIDDEELLTILKNEAAIAKAKANGADSAYREHALHLARVKLSKANIYYGDKIRINFSDGEMTAIFKDIHFSIYDKEPTLYGQFFTKKGKLAAIEKTEICGISNIGSVSKI